MTAKVVVYCIGVSNHHRSAVDFNNSSGHQSRLDHLYIGVTEISFNVNAKPPKPRSAAA